MNTAQILQPLYSAATSEFEKVKFQEVFSNSPALKNAFNYAKQLLINAVELKHPNPNYPYAICVDASENSIGGTLEMQEPDGKWVLLGCYSKHLTPSQKKYSVFKKELYAAHQSVRYFLPEVYGKDFAIFSDAILVS